MAVHGTSPSRSRKIRATGFEQLSDEELLALQRRVRRECEKRTRVVKVLLQTRIGCSFSLPEEIIDEYCRAKGVPEDAYDYVTVCRYDPELIAICERVDYCGTSHGPSVYEIVEVRLPLGSTVEIWTDDGVETARVVPE
jgi:hypothetical protein